jgi:hypothetical protein
VGAWREKEMSDIQRQEIHCHACDKWVQFDLDLELDGNHVLTCPVCGHEHCRVIRGGKITGDRWDQRNGDTFMVSTSSSSVTNYSQFTNAMSGTSGSTAATTYTASSVFLAQSWMNTGSSNG